VPSTNGAAIVVLHGSGSTRSAVMNQVQVLADNGFGVLAYDARGHGESGGRAMDFGWYGERDAEGAVSFLAGRPDAVDRHIGLLGMSMGGEQAVGALASDPRVMGVVAEGATNRVAADKAWLSEVYGVRGAIQEGLDIVTYGLVDLMTAAEPPLPLGGSISAAAPRPVLLITAGSMPDEGHAAAYMRQFSPSSVEVWTVPGAAHTGGLATAGEEWATSPGLLLERPPRRLSWCRCRRT
jgi:pimeloyl-ACP methyl ester carboxylesterase